MGQIWGWPVPVLSCSEGSITATPGVGCSEDTCASWTVPGLHSNSSSAPLSHMALLGSGP